MSPRSRAVRSGCCHKPPWPRCARRGIVRCAQPACHRAGTPSRSAQSAPRWDGRLRSTPECAAWRS
ncbi:MAG: hypothetical protein AB3N23_09370 [Paracoccaceae bacterium]